MTFFGKGPYGPRKPPPGGPPPGGPIQPPPRLPPGYEYGASGRGDRKASRLAAQNVNANELEWLVFSVIQVRGALGTIGSDVHKVIRREMQTITPRWVKLCEKGYIKGKRDSNGEEETRIGHLGSPQTVWYPREPDDPIYILPKKTFETMVKNLSKLSEDELRNLRTIITNRLAGL